VDILCWYLIPRRMTAPNSNQLRPRNSNRFHLVGQTVVKRLLGVFSKQPSRSVV